MKPVRVRMLGGFSVSVWDRTYGEDGWRLKKAASLVKLLALAPDHRLHREQLMDLLWPELDEKAAANNLRHALHVARKVLGADPDEPASLYLRLQDGQVSLSPEGPLWVDVEAFEEAAAVARCARDAATYRAAVELYAGELLPGDLYEGWAEERRWELRSTYLALLLELAGLHEERGEIEAAVGVLEEVVAAEPAREEAHVSLMRLHAASGRRERALRQYERLSEALVGEQPGARTRRLHEEISSGAFPPARQDGGTPAPDAGADRYPGRHNLPAFPSSFIGREREMVEVKRALAMTRLLTLTGAGGSGKTRLALAVAGELAGAYPDGVWLVELAPLSEGKLVPKTVAEVLGVSEQAERPVAETLVDAVREREALILLDNCEHVVDACAILVETLLGSCPRLRVLATSREPLGIAGETSWQVPSLSLPDNGHSPTVGELAGYESARLFVERAARRSSDFALTSENAGAVAEICRQLDGIPLAIELAAARVGVLGVAQISDRLGEALKLLTGGSRTATARQRTLRGALDWGYELLEEPEKRLFCRMSVFTGGWTLEAGEAVGAGGSIEEGDVLDLLSRLVEKSLVEAGASRGGALRYRMLEPLRQYGRERLGEMGEEAPARRRHAAWYLDLAEEAEPRLAGEEQVGWLERLETEHDNFRSTLRWLLEEGEAGPALRLAGALGSFWRMRGHLAEGQGWLEAALTVEGGDALPERPKALNHVGWIAWNRLDFERTTAASEELLDLSRESGDRANVAAALHHLGMVAIYDQMKAEKAWGLFEESLRIRREIGDKAGASYPLQRLGLISVLRQDFGRSQTIFEECLALSRKAGDDMGILNALWLGGLTHLGLGDHEKVERVCEEGLGLAQRIGNVRLAALMLYVLAASVGQQERPVRAARLWGAAESMLDSLGLGLGPAERYHYEPYIAAVRTQLDETTWKDPWAEGRAMTLEETVGYALSKSPEPDPASEELPAQPLTRREREIAGLLARGLTNRQISGALSVSVRTVDKHAANILKKLGLHSRNQIANRLERGQRG